MDLKSGAYAFERGGFNRPISGSYAPQDCVFLLKPIRPPDISVAEKERLIQSGRKHYSEMLSHEHPPSVRYLSLFHEQVERHKARLAQDILDLADAIRRHRPEPLTLVSLARAGTPIGALLRRALSRLGVDARHYSISIVRDRGIDERALTYLLYHERRSPEGIVFVDGWTAKGVIAGELKRAIALWNRSRPERLPDTLCVVSDIGGAADLAATVEDYVIPSGILGATVSGLVSRSILNGQIGPGDFHGCVIYENLRDDDRSNWFLNTLNAEMEGLSPRGLTMSPRSGHRSAVSAYLDAVRRSYGIHDINHIKPGVLEATRVMLRRMPGLLLLRDFDCSDVTHLRLLAKEKSVPVRCDPDMPFNACALIRELPVRQHA